MAGLGEIGVRLMGRLVVRESVTLAGVAERARFAAGVLGSGHPCGDAAALLVSELFGNSVRHSGSGAAGQTVTLRGPGRPMPQRSGVDHPGLLMDPGRAFVGLELSAAVAWRGIRCRWAPARPQEPGRSHYRQAQTNWLVKYPPDMAPILPRGSDGPGRSDQDELCGFIRRGRSDVRSGQGDQGFRKKGAGS